LTSFSAVFNPGSPVSSSAYSISFSQAHLKSCPFTIRKKWGHIPFNQKDEKKVCHEVSLPQNMLNKKGMCPHFYSNVSRGKRGKLNLDEPLPYILEPEEVTRLLGLFMT
jgi:hypothetical protein